jgi:N-acylglucosamine-6-phosphate 2-epimerase
MSRCTVHRSWPRWLARRLKVAQWAYGPTRRLTSWPYVLPIIGIYRVDLPDFAVRITPTVGLACQVAEAGAEIVAVDATARPHPDGLSASDLIAQVRAQTGRMVMADISTVDEGIAAQQAGAELIAATLSGYTGAGQPPDSPDFELVQ